MCNKTEKDHTRGIARVLSSGWYGEVHVKSIASHRIHALLSSRKATPKKCVDLENGVRGLFKLLDIELAARLGHGANEARVRGIIKADEAMSGALSPLLDARLMPYRTYMKLDLRAKKLAKTGPVWG